MSLSCNIRLLQLEGGIKAQVLLWLLPLFSFRTLSTSLQCWELHFLRQHLTFQLSVFKFFNVNYVAMGLSV